MTISCKWIGIVLGVLLLHELLALLLQLHLLEHPAVGVSTTSNYSRSMRSEGEKSASRSSTVSDLNGEVLLASFLQQS